MTETTFPQVRITTERLLNPETTEKLLNALLAAGGIRRVVLNGPRLPAVIPYGPAKGIPNPHEMRRVINVEGQEIQLQVHVGTILLELESPESIPALKTACGQVITQFSWQLKEGRFMKTEPSLVDYAKYGPGADRDLIGMTDPSNKSGPVILQGTK